MNEASEVFVVTDAISQQVMDGFDNFVSKLGLNNENTLSAGVYVFNLMTRNRIQLEAAYRGSWIVGQVIDTRAEDMTKAGIDIQSTQDDDDIKKIQRAMDKMLIWQSLCSGIKWGDLYGGAIGVFQIEGQKLDSPMNLETIKQGQFKGIVIYDRWQLNPDLVNVIKSGPLMGLPEYYYIVTGTTTSEPTAPTAIGQIKVHHSRVHRFIGIELPFFQAITEMMWGESVLERLWDRLISFDTATMNLANLIERANNRVVSVDNLREIIAAGGQALQALIGQFDMMRSIQTNEGITLLDKEDTFQSVNYSFAGLGDVMLQFGQQLAGAAKTTLVRLFGQSPAGLNSTGESDMRTYYDNINAEQNAKLSPAIEKVLQVLWRSTLGKAAPEDLEWSFVPLWQMSAVDKANVAKTTTEAIVGAHDSGLVSSAVALKELRDASGETGIFSNISEEDISEAELEEPPEPEMNPVDPGKPEDPKAPVPGLDSKPTFLSKLEKALRSIVWDKAS